MTDLLNQLVDRLLAQTERGELEWISLLDDTFRAKVGRGSVLVSESSVTIYVDGEPREVPSLRVTVCDERGKVADQVDVPEHSETEYARMVRLYQATRRSARKWE